MRAVLELLRGDVSADRVVPPSGFSATLTVVAAAAMAFLAVFVIALALTAGRQADSWDTALADTATVRISGTPETLAAQAEAVEIILGQTPGVAATRRISDAEQSALLAPWLGTNVSLDAVSLPILIEVSLDGSGPNSEALAQRFAAEAPGAVFDNHDRWRLPMIEAASALRRLSWIALALVLGVTGVTIALAASASLAANGRVIEVLRLVGAEDTYITRAFVRRFTLRALIGGAIGAALGLAAVILVPGVTVGGQTAKVGFAGAGWLWPVIIPLLIAVLAFIATRYAATRRLKEVS